MKTVTILAQEFSFRSFLAQEAAKLATASFNVSISFTVIPKEREVQILFLRFGFVSSP